MPAPRSSSWPGARSFGSTIPTSPVRPGSNAPSGSTSPTTGSATRSCAAATTASAGSVDRSATPVDATRDPAVIRPPARSGPGRWTRPRPWRASWTGSRRSTPTSSTGSPARTRPRSRSRRRSPGSCHPTSWRRIEAAEAAVEARLDPAAAARPGVRDAVDGYADRARPRPVPRRPAERAVPRARPRAADARLGGRRRPAALRTERRGGPRPHRAPRQPRSRPASRPWPPPRGVPGSTAGPRIRGRRGPRPTTTRRSASRRSSRRPTRRRRSRTTRPTTRPSSGLGAPRPGSRTCSSSGTPSGRRPSPSSPGRGVRASSPTTVRLHGCGGRTGTDPNIAPPCLCDARIVEAWLVAAVALIALVRRRGRRGPRPADDRADLERGVRVARRRPRRRRPGVARTRGAGRPGPVGRATGLRHLDRRPHGRRPAGRRRTADHRRQRRRACAPRP